MGFAANALDHRFQTASACVAGGDRLRGYHLLDQLLHADPTHVPALLLRGELLYSSRRFRRARTDFQTALAQEPANARAHVFLGLISGVYGRLEAGRRYFERASALLPDDPTVQWLLADVCFRLGQFTVARSLFLDLLAQRGSDAPTACDIAYSWLHEGELAEALAWFQHAIALAPRYTTASVEAGKVCLLLGLPDHAGHYLRRAQRTDPDSAEAASALAYLHHYRAAPSRALVHIERALNLDPTHLPSLLLKGTLELASGQESAGLARALRTLSPRDLGSMPFATLPQRPYGRCFWLPLSSPGVVDAGACVTSPGRRYRRPPRAARLRERERRGPLPPCAP